MQGSTRRDSFNLEAKRHEKPYDSSVETKRVAYWLSAPMHFIGCLTTHVTKALSHSNF
jgi:hypothetical protein